MPDSRSSCMAWPVGLLMLIIVFNCGNFLPCDPFHLITTGSTSYAAFHSAKQLWFGRL